ncbi:MAG TPA: BatA domain-containing protein, partial [Gemmataceae bacterium]|nr:BatA domain-containing protein [Gemmataceae bacterium]
MFLLHPLLLGGLALMGVPVLLHLMMRQKPKHLMFPAFRFLQQRAKTNQRKIRLRHLLLLLLRMLLIALIVLALVRPRVFSDRFHIANQNAAVAMVIDTSPSMEYTVAGKSRLEEAKQRALEVLDEVGDGSRVVIIDTGGKLQEWASVAEAREQVRNLTPKAGNAPVTNGLSAAYQKFDELDKSALAAEGEALPRILYAISDRTVASWDPGRVNDLSAQRDRLPPPQVRHIFIDVGVDKPIDVAITQMEIKPQAVPANQEVVIKATVMATGQKCDTELECKLLSDQPATTERQPVTLDVGQSQVIEFRKKGLKPGKYQVEMRLASSGPIPSA